MMSFVRFYFATGKNGRIVQQPIFYDVNLHESRIKKRLQEEFR